MKTCSASLAAFMLNPPGGVALIELYTFTLGNSVVLRYCSWGRNVKVGANTFLASGPFIKSSSRKETNTLETITLTLDIKADPSHHVNGQPMLAAMVAGVFEGAGFLLERLYVPGLAGGAWDYATANTMGTLVLFVGTVGEISDIGVTQCQMQINSRTEILNRPFPGNLYMPGCRHTLFDAGCTLRKSDYTFTGAINGGSTRSTLQTNVSQPGSVNPPSQGPSWSFFDPGGGNRVNVNARRYYGSISYVTANGETIPSQETSFMIPQNNLARIASPSSATGVIGWNAYVGIGSGDEHKQNGALIAIGTPWSEPPTFIVAGAQPPTSSTTGYFQQGIVTFTSGANTGVSRTVQYQNGTILAVIPTFPFVPQNGDAFTITPGCDRTLETCTRKWGSPPDGNRLHFAGAPFIPSVASGV